MISSIASGPAAVSRPPPRRATLLVVRSAGPWRGGADRLDVTRYGIPPAGGAAAKPDPVGSLFSPTETILRPALQARDDAAELRRCANDLTIAPTGIERLAFFARADQIEREAWDIYVPQFFAEMRVGAGLGQTRWGDLETAAAARGVEAHRSAWLDVLARASVTFECFCPIDVTKPIEEQRCHRILLRTQIFPALGAVDGGELGAT